MSRSWIRPETAAMATSKPVDFGKRHPDLYPVHGIDVSKWQGDIDWREVRRAGVAFRLHQIDRGRRPQ
jgi:lysozyme